MSNTDRITKTVTLRAPRSRVWKAVSDANEFGTWFGTKLEGAFVEGASVRGQHSCSGREHITFELKIERIEPQRYLAYRWHPFSTEPNVDCSSEPTTLVEFTLEDDGNDTLLTIVESGFDQIPAHRRDTAFRKHQEGWAKQAENIAEHVSQA